MIQLTALRKPCRQPRTPPDCHFPVPNFPVLMKEKKSIFWGSIQTRTARNFYLHCGQVREIRNRRNEELLALFQADGFPIKYEDLIHGNEHTVITRAHFARALLEKAVVTSVSRAFDKYLRDGKNITARSR